MSEKQAPGSPESDANDPSGTTGAGDSVPMTAGRRAGSISSIGAGREQTRPVRLPLRSFTLPDVGDHLIHFTGRSGGVGSRGSTGSDG